MKTSTLLAGTGAAAVLAVLAGWAFAPQPLPVEVAEATRGAFETTVDEDARTRLEDRYVVSAPLAGRLQRVTLREGDPVKEGQAVAALLPSMSPLIDERTLRELQARVGAADASQKAAATRIESARVALELAKVELSRSVALARDGFVAPTKVDADRLGAQAAQKELETAAASEQVARHEAAQARAALSAVRGGSGAVFALKSPVTGRVLRVLQTSEGAVALGTPLLEVGDVAQLEVVAELLTPDAVAAAPGSAVRIERWGGPPLAGTVRRVEPSGYTKISALGVEEQRVKIVIDIASPPAEWQALGDGFRVGVRIVTLSRADVLRVPVSAVFPQPQGAGSAVFVVEDGRARLRAVKVGARNGSAAWIEEGVRVGEKVIVYPPPGVAEGVRVAVRGV